MSTVRVSSKGEVTLPLAVREALGIKSGMLVDVRLDGNSVFVTPIRTDQRATLPEIQALRRYEGPGVPTKAMRIRKI